MENIDNNQSHHNSDIDQKRINETKKGVFGFFITRSRLTLLIIIAIVLLGISAVSSIPRESDPEVKIPIAAISTLYLGASPADVESLITEKLENEIENLDNVKLVTSQSVLGLSSIIVEFEAEADLDDSIKELKDKVNETSGLPSEAEDPIVTQIRANDIPIITFSLAGDISNEQLKDLGETVQDELEAISGVSKVPLSGTREREFAVIINPESIQRLGLPLNRVIGQINSANQDLPLGDITVDDVNYNIRAVAKFKSIEDLKNVVVDQSNGSPVLLQDIATITDALKEETSISRISIGSQPTLSAVSLSVYKKTGGNILNIVDNAKERVEELKIDGTIPKNADVEISSDYSSFIRKDLNTLGRSGLQATALIFIVMLLALSFKEALISLLAIPMTFLVTFFFLNALDNTLNSLVLFALVLSLGLLVDTFIVILEGIFHNMRSGYSATEASLLSVSHYKKPLFSGVFTTISAFIPMLLVSGILGEYLKVLPITIAITLISALFITFIIVPAIASVILKKKSTEITLKESYLEKYLTNNLRAWYRKSVDNFLRSRKQKVIVTAVLITMLISSFGMLIGGLVPVEMFPKVDIDFAFVDVELPNGTSLEKTNELVQQVEDRLYKYPEIKTFVTTIGSGSSFGSFVGGGGSGDNLANINISFVDAKDRDKKSFEINDILREDLADIKTGKITVREISSGPPTGAPIEIRILGNDLNIIDDLTGRLVSILDDTKGVIDVETSQEISPADIVFSFKPRALAQNNLSAGEVSAAIRTAIFGVTATEVTKDNEDIDVVVRFGDNNVRSIEEIKNLSIVNGQGQSIKLLHLADFSLLPALSTISHRDFKRTATISANLETGYTANTVVPEIEKQIQDSNIPAGYEINFGGEVEDIEQSFRELWNAMIVAVLLIIFILVLQFNSFRKPLAIMAALPLTLIGVIIGMLIFGLPFSFSVFLGLVALTGIIVNDAIVLLDKAIRNIEEKNMKPREAVADAGDTRLQPILLTSITTIIGIGPLAFADEFWVGLSISVMFGLAFSTILQLYFIPMVFLKLEGNYILGIKKESWMKRKIKRLIRR
jgi:multidrug efflux pump subunit AcrB